MCSCCDNVVSEKGMSQLTKNADVCVVTSYSVDDTNSMNYKQFMSNFINCVDPYYGKKRIAFLLCNDHSYAHYLVTQLKEKLNIKYTMYCTEDGQHLLRMTYIFKNK